MSEPSELSGPPGLPARARDVALNCTAGSSAMPQSGIAPGLGFFILNRLVILAEEGAGSRGLLFD